jgi:hypothetical protein
VAGKKSRANVSDFANGMIEEKNMERWNAHTAGQVSVLPLRKAVASTDRVAEERD